MAGGFVFRRRLQVHKNAARKTDSREKLLAETADLQRPDHQEASLCDRDCTHIVYPDSLAPSLRRIRSWEDVDFALESQILLQSNSDLSTVRKMGSESRGQRRKHGNDGNECGHLQRESPGSHKCSLSVPF